MSQALGVALAALQYGYSSRVPKVQRQIGGLKGYVVYEEVHTDNLEITEHPIEQGASIADHAFKRPAELVLKLGWSNSPANGGLLGGVTGLLNTVEIASSTLAGTAVDQVAEIYQQLLKLQADRIPFEVFTGKRAYENMLVKSLVVTTDKETENVLSVTATLRQVILVKTQLLSTSQAPAANQKEAPSTAAPVNLGNRQLAPAPKVDQNAASLFLK